jgi:uncharacterized delta-60 repeat protein
MGRVEMSRWAASCTAVLLGLCLATTPTLAAASGHRVSHRHRHRNAQFGHRGKKLLHFKRGGSEAVASYPGGRMLLLGRRGPTSGLLRLRRNGSPDRTFARTGFLSVNASDFAVRRNGKIVVADFASGRFRDSEIAVSLLGRHGGVQRYFGDAGTSLVDFGSRLGTSPRVALAPGGDILVLTATAAPVTRGSVRESEGVGVPLLARLRPDGSLDRSFGRGGIVTLSGSGSPIGIGAYRNGDVMVELGAVGTGGELVRLRADGSLDGEFGEAGRLWIQAPVFDWRRNVFFLPSGQFGLLPDGSVAVAGSALAVTGAQRHYAIAVIRFTSTGALDSSFGSDGVVQVGFPGWAFGHGLAVQRSGRLFVAGNTYVPGRTRSRFAAVCLRPNGTLDPRFGRRGRVKLGFSGFDTANAVVLQPHRTVTLVGSSRSERRPGPLEATALARLRLRRAVR